MRDHVSWCFGVGDAKMSVIPNGVDVTKFWFSFNPCDMRNRFALPSEKIVLFVGRLVPEKGLDVLISALPRVFSDGTDVKLVVVGEGPQKEAYGQMARDHGFPDKVLFAGHLDDWTLRVLYRVADVTVVPSKFEPFGIVALEAMAARCPVIVSSVGGLKEIVDNGGTGLCLPFDNAEAFASAIIRMIRDRGFRDWVVHNAYQKCLWNYNWDKIAEWTNGVYDVVSGEYSRGLWKPAC